MSIKVSEKAPKIQLKLITALGYDVKYDMISNTTLLMNCLETKP